MMTKDPVAIIDGDHLSVYLYIRDEASSTFTWEVVESRHTAANEVIERKFCSETSYTTQAEAEDAGRLKAAEVAKGMV